MTSAAQRMKAMRGRRASHGVRELRLLVPDARTASVRRRIANQVARLNKTAENAALEWIESVSEFDESFGKQ